jgi:adenosylcobinamide-GDP ribazoletransferase
MTTPTPLPTRLPGLKAALHEVRLVAVALQFLTRVPVRLAAFDPQWLHDSARHFPLVGAMVGAFGAAVLLAAAQVWPPVLAVLLAMAATVWLTGGFHEDGLADTCDGLGGAVNRERALAIMKDSRLGSYGALGLVLTLALKAAALTLLASQTPLLAATALVLAHGLSRGAAVALLALLPYGGDVEHAKAKPLAQQISRGGLALALGGCGLLLGGSAWAGLALPSLAVLTPLRLLGVTLAVVAVVAACGRWLQRRLGGYTGDGLGATQQWSELAVYLVLAARAGAVA